MNKRPSELAEIDAISASVLGEPSSWIAYQFDSAVTWFGNHVDNKSLERTKSGELRYTLAQLLADKQERTSMSLAKAREQGLVEDRH